MIDCDTQKTSKSFTEIVRALEQISSFDLWRLTRAIDEMLKDPMRVHAIRSRLRINQEVVYFDTRENREIHATVSEIHRSHVLVKNYHDGKIWHIPFYMLKSENSDEDVRIPSGKLDRLNLKVGDPVGFLNRSNQEVYGIVARLNPKSAEITLSTGERWRVHYHALFHVLEGESTSHKEVVMIQEFKAQDKDGEGK